MRVGVTYNRFWSDLELEGSRSASIARQAVLVSGERQVGQRATLQLAAGGVAQGTLDIGGERYDLGPGLIASLALSYRVLDMSGALPFVLVSASLGVSESRTTIEGGGAPGEKLVAVDARGGLVAGYTFGGVVSPYAAARLFGGPIAWTYHQGGVVGTDRYHYQPALGAVLTLAPVDVSVEVAFAGEKAISAGAGLSF